MNKKKYYFLSGLPRSGNTLLASILNQNPNITTTGNSPLVGYLYGFATCDDATKEIQNNLSSQKSIDNICENVIPNYYSHYKSKYIIDRGSWTLPNNFEILKKYYPNDIKVIIPIRNVIEILASFIKWSQENPNNFIDQRFSNVEEQCDYLMNPDGMIASGLVGIYNMIKEENKKYAYFLDYNSLTSNPKKEIENIYNFLNIKKFNHKFENLNQLSVNGKIYNDSDLGSNLHKVKEERICKETYKVEDYLPTKIIEKYSSYNFWI
jgi:sulfotransferase